MIPPSHQHIWENGSQKNQLTKLNIEKKIDFFFLTIKIMKTNTYNCVKNLSALTSTMALRTDHQKKKELLSSFNSALLHPQHLSLQQKLPSVHQSFLSCPAISQSEIENKAYLSMLTKLSITMTNIMVKYARLTGNV